MSAPWIVIRRRPRLVRRVVVAQQFLWWRQLIGPFAIRRFVRCRFGRRDARRVRRVCAHVWFFRRRLTDPPWAARYPEAIRVWLPHWPQGMGTLDHSRTRLSINQGGRRNK